MNDVLAVSLTTKKVRFMAQGLDEESAEAVVEMAVYRRGVDEEFFTVVKADSYADGDTWKGHR